MCRYLETLRRLTCLPSGHSHKLVAGVDQSQGQVSMSLTTLCTEELMRDKYVVTQNLHVVMVWKFEEQGVSSSVVLVT
ncbi:hypothetical protein TNCV_1036811 [Trichonephila clavipes]|nr:hypothetical protein TNCV_1036811 [Trichonephila clavipes]